MMRVSKFLADYNMVLEMLLVGLDDFQIAPQTYYSERRSQLKNYPIWIWRKVDYFW